MKKLFCTFAIVSGVALIAQAAGIDHMKTNPWNLLKEKKYAEAETVFDLRLNDPKCSDGLKKQALNGIWGIYARKGYYEKGIAAFDKYAANEALAKFRPAILMNKGRLMTFSGKHADAVKVFKEASELTNGKPDQLNILRYALSASGADYKLVKEMPYFLDCTAANPHSGKDILLLIAASEVCWRLNRPTEGLDFARKAEKLMTTPDANVYRVLGYHLRAIQEYEKAEAAFLKAIELYKSEYDKAPMYRNIGETWEKAEEYEKAIPYYKKAAESPAKGWWIKSAADSIKRLQKKIDAGE